MNRLLTFHTEGTAGNEHRIGPTYYMDAAYEKVAVRIYAEHAPTSDAKVDIFDDGVSIFSSKVSTQIGVTNGVRTLVDDTTAIVLDAGANSDTAADNFNDTQITAGSWLHCNLITGGGGRNFTVQLELSQVGDFTDEEEEADEDAEE